MISSLKALANKYDKYLLIILCLGITVRIAASLAWENIIWPDEICQSLEQAHRLVFGYGLRPWEFVAGLRSYLVPLFLAVILLPFKYLAFNGSFAYTVTVRILLCLLSASLIIFAYKYGRTLAGRLAGLAAACLVAVWYEFIYFAPKALGDVLAVYLIVPGLFFAERGLRDKRTSDLALAGLLLALGGMIRYQNLPLLIVPLAVSFWYGFRPADLRLFKGYVYAALIAICAVGVMDRLIWGELFHSFFYALDYYLVRGGATSSGLTPPYWYLQILWHEQKYLLPVLFVFSLPAIPRAKLLWTALVFYLILHSFIPYKEYRYIFLCLPLLMVSAAIGANLLIVKLRARRALVAAALFCLTVFSLYSGVKFTWGDLGYRSGYIDGRLSAWTILRAKIRTYRYLSGRPDIRGLSDCVYNWHWSPGYYYLHKDIPIFFADSIDRAALKNRAANYLISRSLVAAKGLTMVKRIEDIYIYRNELAAQ